MLDPVEGAIPTGPVKVIPVTACTVARNCRSFLYYFNIMLLMIGSLALPPLEAYHSGAPGGLALMVYSSLAVSAKGVWRFLVDYIFY